jgi:hypothetical protein
MAIFAGCRICDPADQLVHHISEGFVRQPLANRVARRARTKGEESDHADGGTRTRETARLGQSRVHFIALWPNHPLGDSRAASRL